MQLTMAGYAYSRTYIYIYYIYIHTVSRICSAVSLCWQEHTCCPYSIAPVCVLWPQNRGKILDSKMWSQCINISSPAFFFGAAEARGETGCCDPPCVGGSGQPAWGSRFGQIEDIGQGCHGWRQQSHPSAVACWTATLRIPHQRRSHPLRAAGCTAGATRRARWSTRIRMSSRHSPLQRPPSSLEQLRVRPPASKFAAPISGACALQPLCLLPKECVDLRQLASFIHVSCVGAKMVVRHAGNAERNGKTHASPQSPKNGPASQRKRKEPLKRSRDARAVLQQACEVEP